MRDWSLGDIKEFYFDWRNVGPYQITELLGWFSQSFSDSTSSQTCGENRKTPQEYCLYTQLKKVEYTCKQLYPTCAMFC